MDKNTLLRSRTKKLNDADFQNSGDTVVYIMSRDQRIDDNHALIAAQRHALVAEKKLLVLFNVYPKSGVRSKQHYRFMIGGIKLLRAKLEQKNIPLLITNFTSQLEAIDHINAKINITAIYFDFSPLKRPSSERKSIRSAYKELPVYVVDTHNIVPVWAASERQETAARTIRPKIYRLLPTYLVEPETIKKHPHTVDREIVNLLKSGNTRISALEPASLKIDFKPGYIAAQRKLEDFIKNKLHNYEEHRNDPSVDGLSDLSPYFHFGQISSLRAVLEVKRAAEDSSSLQKGADAFIEEAVVRKELSDNFCFYARDYRSFTDAADWAKETLKEHREDKREFVYTFEQLESANTHDEAWNAAQTEMIRTGKMHGYMRMYWAKKILEWTETPKQALRYAIELNDKYEIDGNDPNGYVGCLWSIIGVHDRAWPERPIFGKIRYMNYNGLKRKFDIEKYIRTYA